MLVDPKPKGYVLYYVDNSKWDDESKRVGEESVDPADVEEQEFADTLEVARAIRYHLEHTKKGSEVRIFRYTNIVSLTVVDGDWRHTMWEWDEELVED